MIIRRTERLCFNRSHLYTMKKPFTAKIAAGASFRKIYSMPGGGRVPPAMVAARSRTYPCHPCPSTFRKAQYRFPGMSRRTIFPLPPQTMNPGAPRKREHLSTNGRYLPSTPARLPPAWPSSCRNARYCGRGPPGAGRQSRTSSPTHPGRNRAS